MRPARLVSAGPHRRRPGVFLGYIAHGIRQVVPDFGQATLAYLRQAAAELGQHPERAVDVLLNEVLDRVEQQLVLVLDDYHHLGVETPVHRPWTGCSPICRTSYT